MTNNETRYRDYTTEIRNTISRIINNILAENKLAPFLMTNKNLLFNNRNMFLKLILPDYEKKVKMDYDKTIHEFIDEYKDIYFVKDNLKSREIAKIIDKNLGIGNKAEDQVQKFILKKGYSPDDIINFVKGGFADKAGIDFKLKVNGRLFKVQVKKGQLKGELKFVDMIESETDLLTGKKEYDLIVFVDVDKNGDYPLNVYFYKNPKDSLKNLNPRKGESTTLWSIPKYLKWELPSKTNILSLEQYINIFY